MYVDKLRILYGLGSLLQRHRANKTHPLQWWRKINSIVKCLIGKSCYRFPNNPSNCLFAKSASTGAASVRLPSWSSGLTVQSREEENRKRVHGSSTGHASR